jgi:hypothetical protein
MLKILEWPSDKHESLQVVFAASSNFWLNLAKLDLGDATATSTLDTCLFGDAIPFQVIFGCHPTASPLHYTSGYNIKKPVPLKVTRSLTKKVKYSSPSKG